MKTIDMTFDLGSGSIRLTGTDLNTITVVLNDNIIPTITTVTPITLSGLTSFGQQLAEFIQAMNRLE